MFLQTLLSLLLFTTVSAVNYASKNKDGKTYLCASPSEMLSQEDLCYVGEGVTALFACVREKSDYAFPLDENTVLERIECFRHQHVSYCDKNFPLETDPNSYQYVSECAKSLGLKNQVSVYDTPSIHPPYIPTPSPPTQDHSVRNFGAGALGIAVCVCVIKNVAGRWRRGRDEEWDIRLRATRGNYILMEPSYFESTLGSNSVLPDIRTAQESLFDEEHGILISESPDDYAHD
jgi:hypothetical protein